MVLANLSIIDAHLGFIPKEDIIVGENVGVSANYSTEALGENAEFDIRIEINGVSAVISNVNDGAGGDDGIFKSHKNVWAVREGVHLVEVWLDSENEIAETNEDDNYFSFEFTPDLPNLDVPFVWPWASDDFEEIVIDSYSAINPSHPYFDHAGYRQFTNAFSINTVNNIAVDKGIPVVAMADGTVTTIDDGYYDRFTPGSTSTRSNSVRILHDGDHQFQTIIQNLPPRFHHG